MKTEVLRKEEEENTVIPEEKNSGDDSNVFADLADEFGDDDQVSDERQGAPEAESPENEGEEDESLSTEAEVSEEKKPVEGETESETQTEETTTEGSEPEAEAAAEAKPEAQEQESVKEPEPVVDYETLRSEALVEMEKEFSIAEDDAQALVTEPEKVLPKLAAQVYMRAYENATKSIMAAMPQVVNNILSQNTAIEAATNAFYSKWPKLDRNNPQHTEAVNRIGSVYRQVNPKASAEQFTAEVGAQVSMALGIPFEEIIDAPPTETQKPFVPAAPARGSNPPAQEKPKGQFEAFAEEFIDDDS